VLDGGGRGMFRVIPGRFSLGKKPSLAIAQNAGGTQGLFGWVLTLLSIPRGLRTPNDPARSQNNIGFYTFLFARGNQMYKTLFIHLKTHFGVGGEVLNYLSLLVF